MHRLWATIALAGVLTVTGVTAAAASPTATPRVPRPQAAAPAGALAVPPDRATIVLYGDSLAWEAREHFREALVAAGVADVRTSTFGGTAICDWFDEMQADAAALHPTAVVVEFSGNALTSCMQDMTGHSLALDRRAYHAKYTSDAQEVERIFSAVGTRVYFAGAPTTRTAEESGDADSGWLNATYADVARSAGGRYVAAGEAVLDRGHWTDALPCLASEPCTGDGTNVVRAPDGGHFCPGAPDANRGVTDACPVWSSGAYRYGRAMAAAVIRDLRAAGSPS